MVASDALAHSILERKQRLKQQRRWAGVKQLSAPGATKAAQPVAEGIVQADIALHVHDPHHHPSH
jgi:hypothetical protein